MNSRRLIDTAKALVAEVKRQLAMDENTSACDKHFAECAIPPTLRMIKNGLPSNSALEANAHAPVRYAALCQVARLSVEAGGNSRVVSLHRRSR